jgi:hypothetical protein
MYRLRCKDLIAPYKRKSTEYIILFTGLVVWQLFGHVALTLPMFLFMYISVLLIMFSEEIIRNNWFYFIVSVFSYFSFLDGCVFLVFLCITFLLLMIIEYLVRKDKLGFCCSCRKKS